MMVLSSSVSLPSISRRISFPQLAERSRTTRGSLLQMLPMGCMRVFIALPCNSVVIRFNLCAVARKALSACWLVNWSTWLRARTSSPTRFISLSRRLTSTRMELSDAAEERCSGWSFDAAACAAGAETGGFGAGAGIARTGSAGATGAGAILGAGVEVGSGTLASTSTDCFTSSSAPRLASTTGSEGLATATGFGTGAATTGALTSFAADSEGPSFSLSKSWMSAE